MEDERREYGSRPHRWVRLHDGSEHELAKPGSRLLARILDSVVLIVAVIIISVVFSIQLLPSDITNDSTANQADAFLLTIFLLIAGLAYEVSLTAVRGQTLGKQIMSVKVVSITDGSVPGWGKSTGRWVIPAGLPLIPLIGGLIGLIGYLALLWDQNRQTWYDRVAGTVVVKVPR